jgi:hypothetical protein
MRAVTALGAALLSLVATATVAGISLETPGSPVVHTTARGETVIYRGHGLYRDDPEPVAFEAVVWDVVDLALTVPLLAFALWRAARGSLRGRLLLAGLCAYLFYRYLMFAVMSAFNPLFLAYVAIFALAPVAFLLNLRTVDVTRLPDAVSPRFPRRLFVGFTLTLGLVLTALWLARIVPALARGRLPPELAGMATLSDSWCPCAWRPRDSSGSGRRGGTSSAP